MTMQSAHVFDAARAPTRALLLCCRNKCFGMRKLKSTTKLKNTTYLIVSNVGLVHTCAPVKFRLCTTIAKLKPKFACSEMRKTKQRKRNNVLKRAKNV